MAIYQVYVYTLHIIRLYGGREGGGSIKMTPNKMRIPIIVTYLSFQIHSKKQSTRFKKVGGEKNQHSYRYLKA